MEFAFHLEFPGISGNPLLSWGEKNPQSAEILNLWPEEASDGKSCFLPPILKLNSAQFEPSSFFTIPKSFFGCLLNLLSTLLTVEKPGPHPFGVLWPLSAWPLAMLDA